MSHTINKPKKYAIPILILLAIAVTLSSVYLLYKPTDKQGGQEVSQTKNNSNDAYAQIPRDDIQLSGSVGDIVWDAAKAPVVALVHIDSIDGGRTYSPIFEQYAYPQTIGKMTVRDVYRGDAKSGEQLNYSRLGGIVTYDEYWKSLNNEQQDKILHLNEGQRPNEKKYVQKKFIDDIDIAVGKDYVAFLIPQSYKDGSRLEYFIDGGQYGLREAAGSGSDVTVLNNITHKWERLEDVVKRQ